MTAGRPAVVTRRFFPCRSEATRRLQKRGGAAHTKVDQPVFAQLTAPLETPLVEDGGEYAVQLLGRLWSPE